jgi:glycosyltransferase involved in cell wall biosynthesis
VTNADVVICSSHHPFAIHPARRIARRWGARLIFEVRDLWPLTLIELGGASRRNPFILAMQFSEDYAYRHADSVVSVLPGARPYMVAHGMTTAKFRFVPNGVDLSEASISAPLPPGHTDALARLRDRGAFVVGYAGRIGLANALETLISAMAECPDSDICLVLLGNGPLESDLRAQAASLGLDDRIIFLDSVRKDQVPDFLRRVDVAYVGYAPQPLYQYGVSPTKLADYMLASRPVLSAIDAPDDIVATSGAGISCRAGDVRGIADAIAKLRAMSASQRQEMGERGRSWLVAHRDYRLLAARFLSGAAEAPDVRRQGAPS